MVVNQFQRLDVVFRFVAILRDMHMYRRMVIRVEEKTESEEYEDCRHNLLLL